ncbi:MAG: 2-dehydropantoate 2-reductase [Alphaproteobacteria bacterium]|nr:2-dehydropantoate 2-reductase [Alphaproteobacteria bacterium]
MAEPRPRFAIMGSGGVGGYFGAVLARAGYETSFIARGAHLEAMRTSGLRVEGPDGAFTVAPIVATDDPQAVGPVDFVLVAVKHWDLESAGTACRPLVGPDTTLISLMNGVESAEVLETLFADQVLGGVAEISSTIAAPGQITRLSPFARIRFGELDGARTARADRLEAALSEAGVESEHSAHIRRAIWEKFVFLVGLSALTAVTRCPIGVVRADADLRELLQQVMAEARDVGVAAEVDLGDDLLSKLMAFVDDLPEGMRASMAVDLEQGRRLELPWLSGAVVRLGRSLEIATPANAFVCAALKPHQMGAPP